MSGHLYLSNVCAHSDIICPASFAFSLEFRCLSSPVFPWMYVVDTNDWVPLCVDSVFDCVSDELDSFQTHLTIIVWFDGLRWSISGQLLVPKCRPVAWKLTSLRHFRLSLWPSQLLQVLIVLSSSLEESLHLHLLGNCFCKPLKKPCWKLKKNSKFYHFLVQLAKFCFSRKSIPDPFGTWFK